MRKRVVILYSTGGMGHKLAAMALLKAFEKREDVEAEAIDVIEYATAFYKFIYLRLYVFLMVRAKWLWGALYYFSNNKKVDAATRKFREKLDFNSLPRLDEVLINKRSDAIVSTHFLLPSIAGMLKKKKGFNSKLFTLITDYGPHSFWLSDYVDTFFVGSESVSRALEERGIPSKKIKVTGIPTSNMFCATYDVDKLRAKYNLDNKRKTILIMSGGFGVGPAEKILAALNSCRSSFQVIVVSGHNEKAYNELEKLKSSLKYPLVLFGFTDKVAELMAVSDVMITKAGGISVTEALNSGLPMILFASMPGQETWNEDFLVENNAAEKADRLEQIPAIVDKILSSSEVSNLFKESIAKVRRSNAAEEIVEIVMKETRS